MRLVITNIKLRISYGLCVTSNIDFMTERKVRKKRKKIPLIWILSASVLLHQRVASQFQLRRIGWGRVCR